MSIHHVIAIQVAPGRAADFASASEVVHAVASQDEGFEQYELFQSLEARDRLVLLERRANQELLDKHMEAERSRDSAPINALMALVAPGTRPHIEPFEADLRFHQLPLAVGSVGT
jgi:quinol monooxygenase YgiN